MKYKVVSGMMLTLLFIGILTLAFNVSSIAADNGITGLLKECSTFQDGFLYDGSKNHDLNQSIGDDKWNFDEINEWADFANFDGDSAELVIGVNNGKLTSYEDMMWILDENGGDLVGTVSMGDEIRAVVADIPLVGISSFVTGVRATGLSRYIEPNIKVQACLVPNDPKWTIQWGPAKIEADYAWNTTIGDPSVLVAVIDTGIDYDHPDLAANYVPLGYDWVNNNADPIDDNGHGTHCAGIIAAVFNNSIGIAGLAQVRIMAEKGLDESGGGYSDDLANAIAHAVDQGADILSLSWGGYAESALIHDAIKYAYDAGVLVVAAAGNEETILKMCPAAYKEVVAVTATDQSDNPAWFTNFGDWVEIAAPGVDIYSTISKTHHPSFSYPYDRLSGTSMATPHVAGVAALIWSQFPHMTRDQVWTQLRCAADDLGDQGFDWNYGWGRINARRAVEQAPTEHDLVIWDWDIFPALEPGDLATINTTVFNFGKMDESNITVRLLVNGSIVDSAHISFLESNTMATVSCSWIPMVEGMYNITSYVVPVPGETNMIYNAQSRNVRVKVGKFFKVPTDYSQIQDAINWASPGYTILVEPGIYYEHVVIQKSLKLVGEDRSTTIIDGSGVGAVVQVVAEDVYISGFTIQNGGKGGLFEFAIFNCGILIQQSTGIAVINNTVADQHEGILLYGSYGTNKIIGNTVVSHDDAGITLFFSSGNCTINGNTVENSSLGIVAFQSSNNTISNNTVTSTDIGGIVVVEFSDTSKVIGNTLDSNNGYGISITNSKGTTVKSNKVTNADIGIDVSFSDDSNVIGNTLNSNGIRIFKSEDTTVKSNKVTNADIGIDVSFSDDSNVIGNTLNSNNDYGISISDSEGITVKSNKVTNNYRGIYLERSGGSTLRDNNMTGNSYSFGVDWNSYSFGVEGNFVQDIDTSNTVDGKPVYYLVDQRNLIIDPSTFPNIGYLGIVNSANVIVRELDVTKNGEGVLFAYTTNSTIENVNASDNEVGIRLYRSSVTVVGNTLTNNQVSGVVLYGSDNNVVSGNTVTNSSDSITLADSSNNIISGNKITANNQNGIKLFASSNYNIISGNNITNNHCGIRLLFSSNNIISGNNITTNNYCGIFLFSSEYNIISGNNITNNLHGIALLYSSDYNSISGNNITNNEDGVFPYRSSNNIIYHNNFVGNAEQVLSSELTNVWDNGYPSGGNYWSDHNSSDLYSGPYQNEPGSDGIGDTSRDIDGDNQDRYPLMVPISFFNAGTWNEETYYVRTISNSTISGFYFSRDDKLVSFDVNGTDGTVGFCRVTVPRELMWCDSLEEWNVTISGNPSTYLKAMEDANYTYLYFTYNHSVQEVQIKGIHVVPLSYTLTIYSSPTGVTFTVDGVSRTAPWSGTYTKGTSVSLEMPETHDGYIWLHWLEDGDTNRTKTIVLTGNTIWTGVFRLLADINGDRIVSINDVVIAALAFGSASEDDPSTPWNETRNWNPDADLNQDGIIDIIDLVIVGVNFGKTY